MSLLPGRTALVWASLTLVALVPVSANAQTTPESPAVSTPVESETVHPETVRRVRRALFVIEGEAPDSFFASLGEEGRNALIAIVRAEPTVGLRRRAVLALRHYPDARTRAALEGIAADISEDAIVSRYALRSLAMAFGTGAWDTVSHALLDARPLTREGAVLALAMIDLPRAEPLLSLLLSGERVGFVRHTIEATLSRAPH